MKISLTTILLVLGVCMVAPSSRCAASVQEITLHLVGQPRGVVRDQKTGAISIRTEFEIGGLMPGHFVAINHMESHWAGGNALAVTPAPFLSFTPEALSPDGKGWLRMKDWLRPIADELGYRGEE